MEPEPESESEQLVPVPELELEPELEPESEPWWLFHLNEASPPNCCSGKEGLTEKCTDLS